MMQFKEFNVKSIIALFIIVFGMIVLVFVPMEDMVLGAIIGFIGLPLGYFFGASKSTTDKEKESAKLNSIQVMDADIIGGSIPPPDKDEK